MKIYEFLFHFGKIVVAMVATICGVVALFFGGMQLLFGTPYVSNSLWVIPLAVIGLIMFGIIVHKTMSDNAKYKNDEMVPFSLISNNLM